MDNANTRNRFFTFSATRFPTSYRLLIGLLLNVFILATPVLAEEICSGEADEIRDRQFIPGEIASCTTSISIAMGPSVTVSDQAQLSLSALAVSLTPPIRIAEGGTFSVSTPADNSFNQARLGPLSGAVIHAYRLSNLRVPVEGPITAFSSADNLNTAGLFSLELSGIPDDEWILVTASGGRDLDADDDGVLDRESTTNLGTIHALAPAGEWRVGGLYLSGLTEMIWRYTENLVGKVAPEELVIRLNSLAQRLFKQDVDANGTIDWLDSLLFSPGNSQHKAKLNFDYEILFQVDEADNSIMQAILDGDELLLGQQLDRHFGHALTRFPVPDDRYSMVKVELSVFGRGSVVSEGGANLHVDSEQPEESNVYSVYVPKNSKIIFTATPADGSEILGWQGCESVYTPTQCQINLLPGSRSVVASFGYATSSLKGSVHDLSAATNTLSADTIDVVIAVEDDALVSELNGMQVGDFVVGETGDGFLRRVMAITRYDDHHYLLGTSDATVQDVVEQGTVKLTKYLTNGDLLGYAVPTSARGLATVADTAFEGLNGVRLIPSDDPDDSVFHLLIGKSEPTGDMVPQANISEEVVLYDDGLGAKVTATGGLDITIDIDTGASYNLSDGLEAFVFITNVTSTQYINLAATGEIASFEAKRKIGALNFGKIKFPIGPLPVWITPRVEVYLGAEGQIEASLTAGVQLEQQTTAGVVYTAAVGLTEIGVIQPRWTPFFPTLDVKASLRGFLGTETMFLIYDATGPALPVTSYVGMNAEETAGTWSDDSCNDSFNMNFVIGLESEFQWDMSGDTKLGEFLKLNELEDETTIGLMNYEWPLKSWHVDRVGCFTKLDAAGEDLPFGATEWSCVRDDNTGLIWERKTFNRYDPGLRDYQNRYSWYDPNPGTNGGHEGCRHPHMFFDYDYNYEPPGPLYCKTRYSDDLCPQPDCNTYDYVKAVNALNYCGSSNWRMPTTAELQAAAPTWDFFYAAGITVWSGSPGYWESEARYNRFDPYDHYSGERSKAGGLAIRLVRGR